MSRSAQALEPGAAPLEGELLQAGAEDLEQLRANAARYLWLRERSVRIQGDTTWYSEIALDIRVDTALGRKPAPAPQKGKRRRPEKAHVTAQGLALPGFTRPVPKGQVISVLTHWAGGSSRAFIAGAHAMTVKKVSAILAAGDAMPSSWREQARR